jgi:hypothetical protein
MPQSHVSALFSVSGGFYQSLCTCGWLSTISTLEEVDLLRAMHVHACATFGSYQ